jgi:hypothetical protein
LIVFTRIDAAGPTDLVVNSFLFAILTFSLVVDVTYLHQPNLHDSVDKDSTKSKKESQQKLKSFFTLALPTELSPNHSLTGWGRWI